MSELVVSFYNCARCGWPHTELVAKPFERPVAPVAAPHLVWTHWASCPTNGDPILVTRTDKPIDYVHAPIQRVVISGTVTRPADPPIDE